MLEMTSNNNRNMYLPKAVLLLVCLVVWSVSRSGYATEFADSISIPLVMADSYANKADEMSSEIKYHQKMKVSYRRKYFTDENLQLMGLSIEEMNIHCNNIIQQAEILKAEYQFMESMYRTEAAKQKQY